LRNQRVTVKNIQSCNGFGEDMAKWVEDIETAINNLGGIGTLSEIYDEVRRVRPRPHPQSIEAMIRGSIESHSSDSTVFAGRKDLFFSVHGIGKGIWGLRSKAKNTPKAVDISDGTQDPSRSKQEVYRILRDTQLARQLKLLHHHKCQLCGDTINLSNDALYSEAHHIKPLGKPHNGPDVAENILVLCPNHHVMVDYGAIQLDMSKIRTHPSHIIQRDYICYHNEEIYLKISQ